MKFYVIEQQLIENTESAETLADFIRLGLCRYYFSIGDVLYDAWEMANDKEVKAFNRDTNEYEMLDGDIKMRFAMWDLDEDGYRIAELEPVE